MRTLLGAKNAWVTDEIRPTCVQQLTTWKYRFMTGFPQIEENSMGKTDDLIACYYDDLRDKSGIVPDIGLRTKINIGRGLSIYDAGAANVAARQPDELETGKHNSSIKKRSLSDGPGLMDAIERARASQRMAGRSKYPAVVYHMTTRQFGKDHVHD